MRLFYKSFIGDKSDPLIVRRTLIETRWFKIMLHQIMRSDDDRALHDHPWPYLSIVLWGGYWEHSENGPRWFGPGSILARRANWLHRLELTNRFVLVRYGSSVVHVGTEPRPAWTLVFAGARCREWGFQCPDGWRHWKTFGRVGCE